MSRLCLSGSSLDETRASSLLRSGVIILRARFGFFQYLDFVITLGHHAIICHRIPKPIESLNNKTLIDLLLVRHISLTPLKTIGVSWPF